MNATDKYIEIDESTITEGMKKFYRAIIRYLHNGIQKHMSLIICMNIRPSRLYALEVKIVQRYGLNNMQIVVGHQLLETIVDYDLWIFGYGTHNLVYRASTMILLYW
ncbi:hypothetical protein PanWU01x14_014530, partial [Parasponia andersonii]